MTTPITTTTGKEDEIVIFDIETNIFPIEVIEFAAIVVHKDTFVELSRFSSLICCESAVSEKATSIHGLTSESLKGAPPFAQIAQQIKDIMDGRIWMGHNIKSFDVPHLRTAFSKCKIAFPNNSGLIDTLPLIRTWIEGKTENCKMDTLSKYFGLGAESHRAMADCELTLAVAQRAALQLLLTQHLKQTSQQEIKVEKKQAEKKAPEGEKKGKQKKNKQEKANVDAVAAQISQVSLSQSTSSTSTSTVSLPSKSPALSARSPAFIPQGMSLQQKLPQTSPALQALSPMAAPFVPSSAQPAPLSLGGGGTILGMINTPVLTAQLADHTSPRLSSTATFASAPSGPGTSRSIGNFRASPPVHPTTSAFLSQSSAPAPSSAAPVQEKKSQPKKEQKSASSAPANDGWEEVVSKKDKQKEKEKKKEQDLKALKQQEKQQKQKQKQLQRSSSDVSSGSVSSPTSLSAPSPRVQPAVPTWSSRIFPHTNTARPATANNTVISPRSVPRAQQWSNANPSPENVALLHELLEYGMSNQNTLFWLRYSGGGFPNVARQISILCWVNKPHSFQAKLITSPNPNTHFTTSKITHLRIHQ